MLHEGTTMQHEGATKPRWRLFKEVGQSGYASGSPEWMNFRVMVRGERKRLRQIKVAFSVTEHRFARSHDFTLLEAHPDAERIKDVIERVATSTVSMTDTRNAEVG